MGLPFKLSMMFSPPCRRWLNLAVWAMGAVALSVDTARADDWPVGNGTMHQPILSTYGQYYETGGAHLHEGLDILAQHGTPVYAIKDGVILEISFGTTHHMVTDNPFVSLGGVNYGHMVRGNRPAGTNGPNDPGGLWQVGDLVLEGDLLGTVHLESFSPVAHLHLEIGSGTDPYYATSLLRRSMLDPLEVLVPHAAPLNPMPVVSSDIKFRVADHDRNSTISLQGNLGPLENPREDNLYFEHTVGGIPVIGRLASTRSYDGTVGRGTADIDIIAMAVDEDPVSGTLNAPSRIDLRIQGETLGADSGVHTVFDFTGEYLQRLGDHGKLAMQDLEGRWVRTIYSNDATTNSTDVFTSAGVYWFQVTNYDGDQWVEHFFDDISDRDRYWNSDVKTGLPFYERGDATANRECAFPDDVYVVTVRAFDRAGFSSAATIRVILDNWLTKIALSSTAYGIGDELTVIRGYEFQAGQRVAMYSVPYPLRNGQQLGRPVGIVGTNRRGEIKETRLGSVTRTGRFYLVADYNGDGIYHQSLDAAARFVVTR